mmetsp:Transcript_150518/g.273949  ORF Transcript_150518/g.273949 Transcript_150518/m.273949 type:complete len:285 (+) Transcript_150518:75-929(+)
MATTSFDIENPAAASLATTSAAASLVPTPQPTRPPKWWVQVADLGNVLAGIVLMMAFFEGALINSVQWDALLVEAFPGSFVKVPSQSALSWLQFLFSTEGALYAVAEFFMVGIMAATPPEFGGGPRGCMQFAILMAGGVFFAFSGLVFPPCINNASYIFSKQPCTHPAAGNTPYAWNAMAHYGITCFMVGTAIGFKGVLGAPKDFFGPFWGCGMYFAGAWTIGIFKFWGPVFAGGFGDINKEAFDVSVPAVSVSANWWIALLGASFLTTGAVIFAVMNGSFKMS